MDELEELPINQSEFVWRPVRRRFGISAFGTNAYTAKAGQRVVEEHFEQDGHEEMYVVLRGRATFTLGDDEVDAPAGTIVFARPGTKRGGDRSRGRHRLLAVGAKPGVVFEPSPWEDIFAAFSYAQQGEIERAREMITRRDRAAARRVAGPLQRCVLRGALRRQGGRDRACCSGRTSSSPSASPRRRRRTATSTPSRRPAVQGRRRRLTERGRESALTPGPVASPSRRRTRPRPSSG